MRILSLTATSRLAERCVRVEGGAVPVDQLVASLASLDVDVERAQAGIRLAVTVGRLEAVADEHGGSQLRIPESSAVA